MEYLHSLLKFAIKMGASDIHIKANHHPIIRVASQLFPVQVDPPTLEQMQEIIRHMLPQHLLARFDREKEVDFSYIAADLGRYRVNAYLQRGEPAVAMRYVKAHIPSFKELNLPEQLGKIANAERGIVLVTGTTGCGKSSTLAAMIEHINLTEKCHIVTLEDPIEYIFNDNQSMIEQREVGLDTLSFDRALVHVMRQDPDVIMIGEMRDNQSFMAALAAADTGHLVLTTIHTTTAYFFPAHERDQIRRQLAASLQAVVCQRLVPAIAGSVVPAVEIMINTVTVRKLIEDNRLDKLYAAIETGTEDGMQTFNQALYNLVKADLITEEEAMVKATNPEALRMNFRGIFLDESRRILASA
jgi:twitching motility protein PilT